MMRRTAWTGVAAFVGGLLAGCASSVQVPAVTPSDACLEQLGSNPSFLRVGLTQPVDVAHAPVPRNAGERLLFRQLYQTLVAADCKGAVVPQLAESWTLEGNTWEFRLNQNARFTDGTPVTAHGVIASWAARELPPAITGISAGSEFALRVVVSDSFDIAFFADPVFAIAHSDAQSSWPRGSTSFRAVQDSVIRLRSADDREVVFESTGTDERSALDRGVDVLITRDAATLAYARALPGYQITPLPWSRTYVLASSELPADSLRDPVTLHRLLRDAVPTESRPAQSSYWWQQQTCAKPTATPKTGSMSNDATARALAERLAALSYQAQPLPAGVVLAIANLPGCMALPQAHLTPLLETRDYLIHRANVGRIRVFGDGTIQFEGGRP